MKTKLFKRLLTLIISTALLIAITANFQTTSYAAGASIVPDTYYIKNVKTKQFLAVVNNGAGDNSTGTPDAVEEVAYVSSEAFYCPYLTAQDLVEDASLVVIGKVTGISFQMLDTRTSLPPTEKTERADRRIHTIYSIDVITSYKGEAGKSTQLRIYGGLKDYRVDEQLKMIKEANAFPDDGIQIEENIPEIKIGETYLFALYQFENYTPTNLIPDQSIYSLDNPFDKHVIGNHELENPAKYYKAETNEYGRPLMSAKDVISVFGEDKWDAFWTQWQKDNPDWGTRLDKAAVEEALAKSE